MTSVAERCKLTRVARRLSYRDRNGALISCQRADQLPEGCQIRRWLALILALTAGHNFEKIAGRTGFEPVTSSVSGNFRTIPGVCHRRTESNGEPLTWTDILSRSR